MSELVGQSCDDGWLVRGDDRAADDGDTHDDGQAILHAADSFKSPDLATAIFGITEMSMKCHAP